jgi:hypothetical protein
MIIYHEENLFLSSLFAVQEALCTWMGKTFSGFWKFSLIILLNILSILWLAPLVLQCPCFSGSFDGVTEFLLIPFTEQRFLCFSLTSIISLSSEIPSSFVFVCWSVLPLWVFFVCVFLTKGTFYFKDFCLVLFSEVFHIFVQFLCFILCCYLLFIYLSFYSSFVSLCC